MLKHEYFRQLRFAGNCLTTNRSRVLAREWLQNIKNSWQTSQFFWNAALYLHIYNNRLSKHSESKRNYKMIRQFLWITLKKKEAGSAKKEPFKTILR